MNDIQMSKGLGLLSLAIGGAELFAGRRLTRALGLPVPSAFVKFVLGPREIVNGFVAMAHPDKAGPIGTRIAGDALDLAILGTALLPVNRKRNLAALATIAVVGVTILDMAAATALARRETKALATARRTRVKRILA
jgi:hypothetical protein